ncbi:MAG: prolipoprotein diacylglyceryl transferase family protein [Planctomycetota bacterium]
MRETLFYIPNAINDWPVFGFGLLLAAWSVFALASFAWLVRKQGMNLDTLGYVPLYLVVAAAIVWLLPAIAEPRGLPIRGYGVMMLIAVVSATALAVWRARRVGVDPEIIFSLAFWMFVPGILGARLFYVVEYWEPQYRPILEHEGWPGALKQIFNVAGGGLVVYGAFFGGVLGLLAFVRKRRLPVLPLCDLIAPSLILGQAIGRLGCMLNGCCFGGPCELLWAVTFPEGSPPYVSQLERGTLLGFTISEDPKQSPVEVESVAAGSPAAEAGVRRGDRLTAINGHAISQAGAAHELFHELAHEIEGVRIRLRLDFEGPAGVKTLRVPEMPHPSRSLPVHPTQLYSAIDAFLLCFLLLAFEPFARRDGEVFALLVTMHPVARFLLEMIRTDEANFLGTGLSISQSVSLLILLGAAALWAYILTRPRGRTWLPVPPPDFRRGAA